MNWSDFFHQESDFFFLCWVGFVPDFSAPPRKIRVVKVVTNHSSDRFLDCTAHLAEGSNRKCYAPRFPSRYSTPWAFEQVHAATLKLQCLAKRLASGYLWRVARGSKKTRVPWIGPRKLQHVPEGYPKQSIKANMNSTTLRSS